MRAIVFERFGEPGTVLQVRDVPVPEPGPGQVRVRMRLSPINPSDLMTVRGLYGRVPTLPATPGFEGVGIIEKVGPGWFAKLRGLRPGRRVAVLNGQTGNWQEQTVIAARTAVPVPDDLPDEQVAAFFVNPATALVMTRHVLNVPAGAWLVQTAAGSALGRMVIRLGRRDGFHTINLVRRRALTDELKALGADAVLSTTEDDIARAVQELTGGRGAAFGLDAVGGATTLDALRCLGPRGRLLVYGTLAGEPAPLDTRLLMVGQKSIEGFWLSEWVKDRRPLAMLRLFRQIIAQLRAGVLTSPVGMTYPMDRVAEAVTEAERPARGGKVLLRLSAD